MGRGGGGVGPRYKAGSLPVIMRANSEDYWTGVLPGSPDLRLHEINRRITSIRHNPNSNDGSLSSD